MKKTLLAIVLCGSLGIGSAMAAANEEAIQKRVDEVKTEFNLNDQQAKRIAHILSRAGMSKSERKAARMEKRMAKRIAKRLGHMKRKLGLSAGQVSQVKALMTQQYKQRQLSREQSRASLYSILTVDQSNKLEVMMANRKKGHRGHHGKQMHRGGKHHKMCNKHGKH